MGYLLAEYVADKLVGHGHGDGGLRLGLRGRARLLAAAAASSAAANSPAHSSAAEGAESPGVGRAVGGAAVGIADHLLLLVQFGKDAVHAPRALSRLAGDGQHALLSEQRIFFAENNTISLTKLNIINLS